MNSQTEEIVIEDYDLEIDYRDSGRWRSYSLSTHGRTLQSLTNNAKVTETDQDGGEIDTYSLDCANAEVFEKVIRHIITQEGV